MALRTSMGKNKQETAGLHTHFKIKIPTTAEAALFDASSAYTDGILFFSKTKNPFDLINDYICLGKLPKPKHLDSIKAMFPSSINLGLVVGAVEDYQLGRGGITPEEWQHLNVDHHQILIPDYTADVEDDDLMDTIILMRKKILRHEAVLVHCKAGRGRSPTIVFLYLYFFGSQNSKGEYELPPKASYEVIHAFLKVKRPQIDLEKYHKPKIMSIMAKYKLKPKNFSHVDAYVDPSPGLIEMSEMISSTGSNVSDRISAYLTTDIAKKAIAQFPTLKMLRLHVVKGDCTDMDLISRFLWQIYQGESNWYPSLISGDDKSPGNKWAAANSVRLALLTAFKNALMDHLQKIVRCGSRIALGAMVPTPLSSPLSSPSRSALTPDVAALAAAAAAVVSSPSLSENETSDYSPIRLAP